MLVHVIPLSTLFFSPALPIPDVAAYITSELFGLTTILLTNHISLLLSNDVQFAPASSVLKIPAPLKPPYLSPVPA